MKVLILGGSGLISTGITKHLLARKANVTFYNRGKRAEAPPGVRQILGDRANFAEFEAQMKNEKFDVVIDMICFSPAQAEHDVKVFGGRCDQFIFCSTVCTYGVKIPTHVVVDENFKQEPISGYGRNKLESERIMLEADRAKKFRATIIRPSHTYGEGSSLIDALEFDPPTWDRIEKGLPILCPDSGLGLWVSTHRDDCGKLFAYAALNPKTYGECYNATRDENFTWRDYYRDAASALGKKAMLVYMPSGWIVKHDPKRFGGLADIFAWHGAYSSEKAKRDVPEYRCEIDFKTGAKRTLDDVKKRNAWKSSQGDALYQSLVDKALSAGVEPIDT